MHRHHVSPLSRLMVDIRIGRRVHRFLHCSKYRTTVIQSLYFTSGSCVSLLLQPSSFPLVVSSYNVAVMIYDLPTPCCLVPLIASSQSSCLALARVLHIVFGRHLFLFPGISTLICFVFASPHNMFVPV